LSGKKRENRRSELCLAEAKSYFTIFAAPFHENIGFIDVNAVSLVKGILITIGDDLWYNIQQEIRSLIFINNRI
jgi:hypothetical protein